MTTTTQSKAIRGASRKTAYFWLTLSCLMIAVLGFMPTYWMLMAGGTLHAHPLIHMHAAAFYAWCFFLVFQSWQVTQGRVASHREWGMAGISLATIVVVFGSMLAIRSAALASGAGYVEGARAFFIVQAVAMVLFAGFVGAAITNVRNPEAHKRFMLAATVSMLGAPVARCLSSRWRRLCRRAQSPNRRL